MKPYIGLDGKINCDFEQCPLKAQNQVSFPIDIKHPQVIAFAKAMDEVLCKNDYKGGWRGSPEGYLKARLVEEMGEYFAKVAATYSSPYRDFTEQKELIDIANFCMMLWDRIAN